MTTTDNTNGPQDHVAHRMQTSRDYLHWLSGELAHHAQDHNDFRGKVQGTAVPAEGTDHGSASKLQKQVARVCGLVNLALCQVDVHDDLGLAWILLEQARQQLGHAATAAAQVRSEQHGGADQSGPRTLSKAEIVWLLQRDRMPWSHNAAEALDFGGSPGLLPDLLPDTPLELLPLQLLAHTTMTLGAADDTQDDGDPVMAMAFGEYVSTILTEAMELLESAANLAGADEMDEMIETGHQVADLISGAFPPAWKVFQGPAGFPGSAA